MLRPRTRKARWLLLGTLIAGLVAYLSRPAKATVSVTVLGAMVQPGKYELARGSKIEDALAAAGGYMGDLARVPDYVRVQESRWQKESDFRYVGLERYPESVPLRLKYEDEKRIELQDGWTIHIQQQTGCATGWGMRFWPPPSVRTEAGGWTKKK